MNLKSWAEEQDYNKAKFQLRSAVTDALDVFDKYGQGVYIKGAVEEILKLADDYSLRLRGVDKPLSILYVRRKK